MSSDTIRVHAGMASTAVTVAVAFGGNCKRSTRRRSGSRGVACRAARNDSGAAPSSADDDDAIASASFSKYDETSGAVKT